MELKGMIGIIKKFNRKRTDTCLLAFLMWELVEQRK